MREIRPAASILLYSGYADGVSEAELAQAGVQALLAKPVDTAALFRHLERILVAR